MDKAENYQRLKFQALEWGFDLFGVADVTKLRAEFALGPKTAKKFGLAVSLGKRLNDAVMDDIQDQPTPLYFHHYRQTNFFLDRGALLLADRIQGMGSRRSRSRPRRSSTGRSRGPTSPTSTSGPRPAWAGSAATTSSSIPASGRASGWSRS